MEDDDKKRISIVVPDKPVEETDEERIAKEALDELLTRLEELAPQLSEKTLLTSIKVRLGTTRLKFHGNPSGESTESLRILEEMGEALANSMPISISELIDLLYKAIELQDNFSKIIDNALSALSWEEFNSEFKELNTENKLILSEKVITGIKNISTAKGMQVPEKILEKITAYIITA